MPTLVLLLALCPSQTFPSVSETRHSWRSYPGSAWHTLVEDGQPVGFWSSRTGRFYDLRDDRDLFGELPVAPPGVQPQPQPRPGPREYQPYQPRYIHARPQRPRCP